MGPYWGAYGGLGNYYQGIYNDEGAYGGQGAYNYGGSSDECVYCGSFDNFFSDEGSKGYWFIIIIIDRVYKYDQKV